MIYPESFENKVGFDRIRELLAEKCIGPSGRARSEKISFTTNPEKIDLWLSQTDEFKELVNTEKSIPLDSYYDIVPLLDKMQVKGFHPDAEGFYNLKRTLETVKSVHYFLLKIDPDRFTLLNELGKKLKVFSAVHEKMDMIMSPKGEIRDKASSELAGIRRTKVNKEKEASVKIHSLFKEAQKNGLAGRDESLVVRDGRLVIPVDSGKKRKIKGVILDESATGKTAYVEPVEIFDLNNEIRELGYAEKREIIRILIAFTDFLRPYIDEIINSFKYLGMVDFIRAKALLAKTIGGIKPLISDRPGIKWDKSVHPLLFLMYKDSGKKVVPLDIRLNSGNRILVVSGPNAGGKSVCLQTIGLLQYMLQCGLLIPVDKDSEAGIFNDLFIHMGDDQSIDNDLSTYSSHLVNMKYFIRNAGEKSLVLIDEFGSGTEPMLGGAIAESILTKLNQTGTYGVVTTHYTNLKHFASSTEGIENAAMLFDNHKMEPLFRLEIGKPGSSFAFEIARKIGLPENILKKAQEKIGKEHVDFDKHLKDVVRDKRYWERKRDHIRKSEKKLSKTVEKYSEELESIKKSRKELIESAKEEANEILENANKRIENTVRKIKEAQAEKERTKKIRKELEDFKKKTKKDKSVVEKEFEKKLDKVSKQQQRLQKRRPGITEEPEKKDRELEKNDFRKGDKVFMIGVEKMGEVLEVTAKNVIVTFGNIITTVERGKLRKTGDDEKDNTFEKIDKTGVVEDLHQRKLKFNPEIDIRGKRGDEALQTVADFIDEAVMVDEKNLRILHGKGDGILRQLVREWLQASEVVKKYQDEHIERGGTGITVVELDI